MRMVVPELTPVGVHASRTKQLCCTRVVQTRVVQDNQARVLKEVRPHVVVPLRIPELVDDHVVRRESAAPDEVVGVYLFVTVNDEARGLEHRQHVGAVAGDASGGRWEW